MTVSLPTLISNFRSSPWIRLARQLRLLTATSSINAIVSAANSDLPFRTRDFLRQYNLKPCRCHLSSVPASPPPTHPAIPLSYSPATPGPAGRAASVSADSLAVPARSTAVARTCCFGDYACVCHLREPFCRPVVADCDIRGFAVKPRAGDRHGAGHVLSVARSLRGGLKGPLRGELDTDFAERISSDHSSDSHR